MIATKATFTVSRDGFSSHDGDPGDPKNGPNLRTRGEIPFRLTVKMASLALKVPNCSGFGGRATWKRARNSSQIAVKGPKI